MKVRKVKATLGKMGRNKLRKMEATGNSSILIKRGRVRRRASRQSLSPGKR